MTVETRPAVVPARTKTVADVLRHAALIIEERGWCQSEYESPDGRLCTMGAVYKADGTDWLTGLSPLSATAVERLLFHLYSPIATWNDTPGRTAAEVIAALRAAADAAERES